MKWGGKPPVSCQIGDIGADRIDNLLRQIPHLR